MVIRGSILFLVLLLSRDRTNRSIETEVVEERYDFIVVGGGTTGAALAGRLSEDTSIKILVLEAGKSVDSYPEISVPANESPLLSDANWDFKTVPQQYAAQALVNMTERWPRGKILGGTSSINHLIYHRGSPHDFDSWEDHGAVGWSWNDVEKYFVKAEGAQDDGLSSKLGRDGPLKISKAYGVESVDDIFRRAAAEIGIGSTDYIDSLEGFSSLVATKYHGLRINSVEAYLRDHFPERKNRLHIVCGAYATKVLFDESSTVPAAIGVEFEKAGVKREVYATKEVILSAGVIGTPHLLMLSGIGSESELEKHNIPLIANLPGVGSNLKDHVRMTYHLYSDKLPETPLSNRQIYEEVDEFVLNGTGPLTNSKFTSYIHHRTNYSGTSYSASTDKRPFPEIQIGVYPVRSELTDIQTAYDARTYKALDYVSEVTKAIAERNGAISNILVVVGLQHSKSSGAITLRSKDHFQPPLIDPAFFSDEDDLLVFADGLKLVEQLLDTETFRKLDVKHVFQPYCNEFGSERPRSNEYLQCWLRQVAVSEYHPCCTAKIGNDSDSKAVVDERLRVRKVTNLRAADASIMPHEISGNPQGTCYMIAEKAAAMIKEDWSLMR